MSSVYYLFSSEKEVQGSILSSLEDKESFFSTRIFNTEACQIRH